MNRRIPWGEGESGEAGRPVKLAAMWTDAVMTRPDVPPTRGFGGRLLFYNAEAGQPVKVKGSLVVYAFDETHRDPSNNKADKKYVFEAEEFAKHYSKCKLGHSYSVWIPWDKVGGEQKQISLICRFTPETGGVVVGEQSTQALEGKLPPEQRPYICDRPQLANLPTRARGTPGAVQQAGFVDANAQPPRQAMSTTTISVPDRVTPRSPRTMPPSGTALNGYLPIGNVPVPNAAVLNGVVPYGQGPQANFANPAAIAAAQRAMSQGATAQASASPSARFAQQRRRALGEPIARLHRDRGPSQQHPAGWPSGPPAPLPPPAATAP